LDGVPPNMSVRMTTPVHRYRPDITASMIAVGRKYVTIASSVLAGK